MPSGADDPTDGDPAGPVPIVSRVEPRVVPRGTTLDVRIFGSGFDPASRVRLRAQGSPANGIVTNSTLYVSSSELTASITTAGDAPAGPYEVVVTSGAGKQGVGTELVDFAPHIRAISPSPARPGETIRISGWNFGLVTNRVTVTIDGREAAVLSADDTTIVAVVPPGVSFGTVAVVVSVAGVSIPASSTLEITDLSEVGFVRIEAGSSSITIAPGDTARLTVIVWDHTGAVIADPDIEVTCGRATDGSCRGDDGRLIATIDATGLVTGGPVEGTVPIVARSRGVNSNTVYLTVSPLDACLGCWDY